MPDRLDPVADWLNGGHARPTLEEIEAAGYVVVERRSAEIAEAALDRASTTVDVQNARIGLTVALDPSQRQTSPEVYRGAVWTR